MPPPGVSIGSAPTAASAALRSVTVAVRDTTGRALIRTKIGSTWGAWQPMGTGIKGAPSIVSWGPDRLDLFFRDANDKLIHRWKEPGTGWDPTFQSFHPWSKGKMRSAPASAAWGTGRLDTFMVGPSGVIWHKRWDSAAGGWFPAGTL